MMCFSLPEIEAKEACTWLRAAGFPQYAQLYEGKATFISPARVSLHFSRLIAVTRERKGLCKKKKTWHKGIRTTLALSADYVYAMSRTDMSFVEHKHQQAPLVPPPAPPHVA